MAKKLRLCKLCDDYIVELFAEYHLKNKHGLAEVSDVNEYLGKEQVVADAAHRKGRARKLRVIDGLDDIDVDGEDAPPRPVTRADCVNGPRPCPWVGCRHHLYLEVSDDNGSMRVAIPDTEPEDLVQSCSLDVADDGEHTLEEIGQLMGIVRERARQIEAKALISFRRRAKGEMDD